MAERTAAAPGRAVSLTDPRLGLVVAVSFLGIFGPNAASAVLPGVADGLGVGRGRIGLVTTAFFLPAVLSVPAAGVLADLYGRRPVVLGGLALFGVGGTAIAAAGDFRTLLLLRGLQGLGFAGLTPMTVALIGDLYGGSDASTVHGLRISANSLAAVVAPAAAGLLAGVRWNYAFLLYALAAPLLAAAYLTLPETGTPAEDAPGLRAALAAYWRSIRAELADRTLAVFLVGGFALFFLKTAVLTYLPLYAVDGLGASAFLGGALLSVQGAVRFVVAPLSGRLVAALSLRRTFLGAVAVGTLGAGLLPLAPDVRLLAVAAAVYAVGDALFVSTVNDAVASLASPENRAGVVGGANALKMCANTVAPAALGVVLVAADFAALFGLVAAVGLAYLLLAGLLLGPLDR